MRSETGGADEPQAGEVGEAVRGGPARRPARDLRLEGTHVALAPLDPAAHAEALYRASHGPEAQDQWRYLGPAPFPDLPAFRAYLDAAAAGSDPHFLTILDRRDGIPLGHATYMRIEPAQRVIEVGNILFTPRLQRTPAATEAMYLMARHAFEDLGYRRYEWKCNALNAPSRRAALRYGFRHEGLFRQHMIVKGRNRDTAWFSMLDREWPMRRRSFETWLDPENFDGAGRQRLALAALNATAIPGMELRRADLCDATGFGHLQAAAYARNRELLGVEPLPLTVTSGQALAQNEVWLAEAGGAPCGALALQAHPDHLLIWSVATDPAAQGQGLGRHLLAAAEARARALGLSRLRLYTGEVLSHNVAWYARHGYETLRVEALPDRRIVHMEKRLGP